MEHKWRDEMMRAGFVVAAGPDRPLTITALVDGTAVEQPETLFAIPGYFVREFFRLAEENERLRAVATPLLLLFAERLAVWERMNSVEARAAFGGDPYPFPEEVNLTCSFPVTVLRGLAHVTPPAQEAEEPPGTSSPAPRD